MPADGLIAAHSMQGETSARSPSKGSLLKFKPFHTNEKGIRTSLVAAPPQDSLGSVMSALPPIGDITRLA